MLESRKLGRQHLRIMVQWPWVVTKLIIAMREEEGGMKRMSPLASTATWLAFFVHCSHNTKKVILKSL
jgi:hypothetical protein